MATSRRRSHAAAPLAVSIPGEIVTAVVGHSRDASPLEACGLLAIDVTGALRMAYCLGNAARSRVAFRVDPDEHFAALRDAEQRGWRIGGVFHSHPRGSAVPSRSDIAGALDPGWWYLIVGLGPSEPELRMWRVRDGSASEVPVALQDVVA